MQYAARPRFLRFQSACLNEYVITSLTSFLFSSIHSFFRFVSFCIATFRDFSMFVFYISFSVCPSYLFCIGFVSVPFIVWWIAASRFSSLRIVLFSFLVCAQAKRVRRIMIRAAIGKRSGENCAIKNTCKSDTQAHGSIYGTVKRNAYYPYLAGTKTSLLHLASRVGTRCSVHTSATLHDEIPNATNANHTASKCIRKDSRGLASPK